MPVKKEKSKTREAIRNLREAWKFYQLCKTDPDAGKTGAKADAPDGWEQMNGEQKEEWARDIFFKEMSWVWVEKKT